MNKTFIICAGLGTTGTSTLDITLGKLGYRTAKWTHITDQPSQQHIPSDIMKPLYTRKYSPGMFDNIDAVLDSPAIDFLPWILKDVKKNKNIKVILTNRNPQKWALRRKQMHPCSAPPFRTWFLPYKTKCTNIDTFTLKHGFIGWYAYVRELCKIENIPLLEINLFEESEAQWKKNLLNFLNNQKI